MPATGAAPRPAAAAGAARHLLDGAADERPAGRPAHRARRLRVTGGGARGARDGGRAGVDKESKLRFLDKLINIALPQTKDFRGIKVSAIDDMGNITIGIKEHTIFPETSDEDLKDVFGMGITIVTTAKNKEAALAFFKHLGIPFKK